MMNELRMEMVEMRQTEQKASAFDNVIVLLENAITYMLEQGMSNKEISEYLGTDEETLNAIDIEDFEFLAE